MPSTLFALSGTDLQKKLQPVNGNQTFLIGDGGDLTTAEAEEILNIAEDRVLMRLHPRYRQLLREVDGEILVRSAQGGESVFVTGIAPVSDVKLWLNFPRERMWESRSTDLAMASVTYSVDATTGTITLAAALVKGDRLFATYKHTGANKVLGLRDSALTLAAVEVSRRFAFFRDGQEADAFGDWESSTYQDLNNLKGVDLLDRLELVRGETEPEGFYRRIVLL